jgi:glucan phosphorylase
LRENPNLEMSPRTFFFAGKAAPAYRLAKLIIKFTNNLAGTIFLFGLTVGEVQNSQSWYNPHWHYDNEPETRAALDLIFSDYFGRNEPGAFTAYVIRCSPTVTATCTWLISRLMFRHRADLEIFMATVPSGREKPS